MRKMFFTFFLLTFALISQAQDQREYSYNEEDTTYTMKRYVFMLLNKGKNQGHDSIQSAKLQELHMEHLNKLSGDGKLILAGPFEQAGDHRGLLIFDVATIDEALKLEGEDPVIKSGKLSMEAFYWWGAKGTVIK